MYGTLVIKLAVPQASKYINLGTRTAEQKS